MFRKDIFSESLIIGNEAYIVGSSPSVVKDVKNIPKTAFVSVCNAAILLDCPKNLWFVFDKRVKTRNWWKKIVPEEIKCPRVFGENTGFEEVEHEYTFKWLPKVNHNSTNLRPNILRGGATIAGCVLQFYIQKNVKKIYLCGISMDEPIDFENTITEERGTDGIWCQKPLFIKLCEIAEKKQIEIVSLTHNTLGVPVVK